MDYETGQFIPVYVLSQVKSNEVIQNFLEHTSVYLGKGHLLCVILFLFYKI